MGRRIRRLERRGTMKVLQAAILLAVLALGTLGVSYALAEEGGGALLALPAAGAVAVAATTDTKRLRVIKDCTLGEQELKVGMIVNADATTAAEMIEAKQAEVYDPDAEKAEKERQAAEQAAREAEMKRVFLSVIDEKTTEDGDGTRKMHIVIGESELEKSGMGGFQSTAHFLCDVVKAGKKGGRETETLAKWHDVATARTKAADGQTKITSVMQEGDDEQGGYLVPPDIAALWMPPALEQGFSGSRAMHIPVRGNRVQMPALVDATHVGSYFGGIIIYRPGEAHQKTNSKPNLRLIELTLHKMAVIVPVSDEMIDDSPVSMAAFLNNVVPAAISFQQDWDNLAGTGANMALGATNAANPSLIAVAAEAGQLAATIVYENIVNMWARFKMINSAKAVWVAGHDCFPQLATMALAMGTAGVAVWQPANLAAGQPLSVLMGLPLVLSEKTQLLGVQGDICLIDWSQYYIADKGGLKADQSMHLWFDYDLTAFRFVLRSDGQPAWATPLTPANGGPTVSPFVVLAARP